MNKKQAIKSMREGNKVTHTNFATGEWVTIKSSKIVFEDGMSMTQKEFWSDRTDPSWDDGYSLHEEPKSSVTLTFSELKIGAKFILNNVLHKKTSSTATYGRALYAKDKKKTGIYTFNPNAKLTFTV